MSPPVNPNDLTRHQLDELDALLQRMLSLPLGGASPGPVTPDDRPAALTMPDLPPLPAPGGAGTWRNDAAPTHRLPHTPAVMGDANTLSWVPDAMPRSTPANFHVPAAPALAVLPPPSVEVIPDTIPLFGPPRVEARTLRGVDAPPVAAEPVADVVLVPAPRSPAAAAKAPGTYASGSPTHASAAMFAPPGDAVPADPVPLVAWPLYAANAVIETGLEQCGPLGRLVTNRVSKQFLGWSGVALLLLSAVWLARGYGLIDFPLPSGGAVASALGR